MSICYEEASGFSGALKLDHVDAVKCYLKHFENLLLLQFLANHSPDRNERHQATKEMAIAERKMKFWERHHNFERDRALKGCEELKKQWQGKR